MKIILLFPLALGACATLPKTRWELPTGEPVACKTFKHSECGLELSGCGAEESVTFDCLPKAGYAGLEAPGGETK
jgi:hypothetical protein